MNIYDEFAKLIADCDRVELICIRALICTTVSTPPLQEPYASRGELKRAIKKLRIAQHRQDCGLEYFEAFEAAIQYIRCEWLHR